MTSITQPCPIITLSIIQSWPHLDLLLALDVCPRLSDMWGETWPHDPSSPDSRSHTEVFCSDSEPVFDCMAALGQIRHRHVFIQTGGGRVDDEAKWWGRDRHKQGLVATSFMRRSCAAKPSVIFIYFNSLHIYNIVLNNEYSVRSGVPAFLKYI